MIDHISIQCADPVGAAELYDRLLGLLGGRRVIERGPVIGYGTRFPTFWIGPLTSGPQQREVHLAFTAPDRAAVDRFHQEAIALGCEVLHPPRLWPEYHPGYYGCFVRDRDGNNLEAVHHSFGE